MNKLFETVFELAQLLTPKKYKPLIASIWISLVVVFAVNILSFLLLPLIPAGIIFFTILLFVVLPLQATQYQCLRRHWVQSEEFRRKESNIGKYYSTFNKPDGVWYEFTWDVPYSEEGGPTQEKKKKELRDKKIDSIF